MRAPAARCTLVEREASGERFALKLLAPELARDERFRRRFERESTIAAQLRHPRIVEIVDFGASEAAVYLVMRHIEGADLRVRLARGGPLALEVALRVVTEVGEALDEAHARGLVHRDVKPANILLDGEDHAYLTDFGLAKHASSASSLTGEQSFVGTIAYVSPEQIRGDELDGRADVYSLTCVLYELLAGRAPFERDSDLAAVFAHLNEPLPRITDLRPELPAGLDRVLRAGAAKDPDDRYATCAQLVAAARGAQAGERGPRAPIRRRALLAAAAVAVAAGAVVVVLAGARGDRAPVIARAAVGGDGLALLDPATGTVAARVRLPGRASDLAFGGRLGWVLLDDKVVQLDAERRTVRRTISLSFRPGGIAAGGGSAYVTEAGGPAVARISRDGRIAATWQVPARGVRTSDPTGIAVGAGSVWLARGPEVVRVDARSGRVQRRFPLTVTATLVAFADGDVWAASSENGLVEKIDPVANRIVARARLHGWLSALTVAGGSVWATAVPDDVVFRLDADDASLEGTHAAPAGPGSLAAGAGSVFAAGSSGRAVARLDIGTGHRRDIALSGSPELVRFRDGLLWMAAAPWTAPPAGGGRPADPGGGAGRRTAARPRRRQRPDGRPAPLRDVPEARQLPGRARCGGARAAARGGGGDAGGVPGRSDVHVPHPARPALLAAVARAGGRARVRAHDRARALTGPRRRQRRARGRRRHRRRAGLQRRTCGARARAGRARRHARDHAPAPGRRPAGPARPAGVLRGAGRHAVAESDARAGPDGRAVLRALEHAGAGRARPQPELPRPSPAAAGPDRLPDRRPVGQGRGAGRRRPGRAGAVGLRSARPGRRPAGRSRAAIATTS